MLWSKLVRNGQGGIEVLTAKAVKEDVQVRWAVDLANSYAVLLLGVLGAGQACGGLTR
ncbi:IS110 family transposase [Nocardiopsis sp. JB363]|uniref:IS110 family transposase n=1 Tax=Nocardiopsis sp. JB363 TaxID=1434837 RepID=UPI0011805B5B|nr:IS110 family transposase [Nocardiopsis sp. JB363]